MAQQPDYSPQFDRIAKEGNPEQQPRILAPNPTDKQAYSTSKREAELTVGVEKINHDLANTAALDAVLRNNMVATAEADAEAEASEAATPVNEADYEPVNLHAVTSSPVTSTSSFYSTPRPSSATTTSSPSSSLSFRRYEANQAPDAIREQNRLAPGSAYPGPGNLSEESQYKEEGESEMAPNPANGKPGRMSLRERGRMVRDKFSNSRVFHPLKVNENDGLVKRKSKQFVAEKAEHAAIDVGAEVAIVGAEVAAPWLIPFIIAGRWAAKHRHGIKKFINFMKWLMLVLLFLSIGSLLLALAPKQGGEGNQPPAIAAYGSANVQTVSTLDGLTIPFPDTKLGHERHFADSQINGTHYIGPDSNPTDDGREPSAAFGSMTPDEERWYFNEPWGYPNDKSSGCVGRSSKWKGKKLLVTSTETHKSVIVSVQECGPNYSSVTRRDGIGAGAPPEVFHALGITNIGKAYDGSGVASDGVTPNNNKNRVTVAFVADQSLPLGPVAAVAGPGTSSVVSSGSCVASEVKVPTESQSEANLTTISFPAWKTSGSGGSKTSTTMTLRVNKCGAASLKKALEEIYADPSQFAFKGSDGIATVNWRCKRRAGRPDNWCGTDISGRSVHSWGIAVDINPDENPQLGSGPNPYAASGNPFALQANGAAVRILKANGWYWGGEWNSSKDYMHFSPLNE